MIYIGIDPGQKGGIAIIKKIIHNPMDEDTQQIFLLETPLNDKEIDVMTIAMFLRANIPENEQAFCILEKAQPMPKQGVTSVFNYGEGYGELKAMLKFLKIKFQEVRPQVWKKEFNLNTDKKRSASTCINLFPSIKEQLYTPRGRLKDGIAESLLMAEYGRRIYK